MKLNVDSTVESPALPAVLAYLRARQWIAVDRKNANWTVFQQTRGTESVELDVPMAVDARDFKLRMQEFILNLVELENRPARVIVRDIAAVSTDTVRVAIEGAGMRDGRIPIAAGLRVYSATRDMMLAAACSVIDPRPVFAKRKPEEAMKLLERARFGQTEVGSFVITVECSVAPALQLNFSDDEDLDAPMERKACRRLATGLGATQSAVIESLTSGGIEAFEKRTRDGVSANLCDAVAEMLEATGAESVRTSFSFAGNRPMKQEVPKSVFFTADSAGTLREAAIQMRATNSYADIDLHGPVFKLQREGADSGEIAISADVDGEMRSVRMLLDRDDYQIAVVAHRDSRYVRCIGDLQREGRSWVLQNVRNFGDIDANE